MRRADIFLLISGAFYTLERCTGLVSDWYGPPTNHNAKRPALCGPFFPAVTLFCHILQNPNGNFSPAGIAPTARAW